VAQPEGVADLVDRLLERPLAQEIVARREAVELVMQPSGRRDRAAAGAQAKLGALG
jgi:hypothetical protein